MSKLNDISCRFDRESASLSGELARGKELIPLLLDHVLPNCCSPQVVDAFLSAVEWYQREVGGD